MGWIRDGAYDHEGWVALVLDDGRVTGASTSGGVVIMDPTPADLAAGYEVRQYPMGGPDVVIPWERVALWRVECQCGWKGGTRPAVDDPKYGTRHCPEELEEQWFLPQWQEHVTPFAALAELGELDDQVRVLNDKIREKVTLARDAGASWSQIGRELSMSKQAAQQRFST